MRHFRASSYVQILDLIPNNQIWEVHTDLRNNLLSLKIVDCEPELLSHKVTFAVFDNLSEYQWSLYAVVVFEFDSFVDNSPCLVLSDDFTLLVCWNSSLNLEREEFNARLAWTNHLVRVGVEYLDTCHSWKQVLSITRQKSLVLHEQVLLSTNLKEGFAVFCLPIAALDQSQLRHLS